MAEQRKFETEYELRDGNIVLFHNPNPKNPKQPQLVGTAMVDGKRKTIALWERTAYNGNSYFSGTIGEEWKPAPKGERNSPPPPSPTTEDEDDVPF
jgi:hypothetical protein